MSRRNLKYRRYPVLTLAALVFSAGANAVESDEARPDPSQSQQENRQDLSIALSANVQTASLMRQLLDGRNAMFIGRIEGESALYNITSFVDQNGIELRQFKAGIAGVPPWWKSISYKFEMTYSNGDLKLGDAYIQHDFDHGGSLSLGNQSSSQSLNANTGSLSRLFMEEPLVVSAFTLSDRLGLSYDVHKHRGGGHLVVFSRSTDNENFKSGMAARGYFNPTRSDNGLWHIGASFYRQKIGDGARISTRPESHVTDIRLVDTGQYSDVSHQTRLGIELAGAAGTVTGRIEAMLTEWKRHDGSTNRFAGAYLEAGFSPSGLPFRYRDGKFLRPQIGAGESAWEMAVRFSWIDLNSDDVQGGREFNSGLAINYYPVARLRVQFNAIVVNSDRPDSDGWFVQGRLQYNW